MLMATRPVVKRNPFAHGSLAMQSIFGGDPITPVIETRQLPEAEQDTVPDIWKIVI